MMNNKTKKVIPTKVASIDWKSSFSSHPFIILYTENPIEYRIVCESLSDDGKRLTIVPSMYHDIDTMLYVLEGCLLKESNFRVMLEEHYGDNVQKLIQIECNFNGIEVVIDNQMTAWEAKLNWLRDGLNAGYKNLVNSMSIDEKTALKNEEAMK